MKKKTKEQVLISLMINDYTSALDGIKHAKTTKLPTRVSDFRKDFKIVDRWVESKSEFGVSRYKEYKIVKPSKKALAKYGL